MRHPTLAHLRAPIRIAVIALFAVSAHAFPRHAEAPAPTAAQQVLIDAHQNMGTGWWSPAANDDAAPSTPLPTREVVVPPVNRVSERARTA